jgi:putative methyltransferase (TIGR04325 family)
MASSWKKLARALAPPALTAAYVHRFRAVRYVGSFATWAEASANAGGYAAPNILEQVTEAARAVRDGRAAFERDGVAFAEPAFNWPLLTCLQQEASKHRGALRVLDFGGSLGSVYFQHQRWLAQFETHWAVVEQPAFVAAGRREFATAELSFHDTIAEAIRAIQPNVVLFSGVLAWIERPQDPIDEVMAASIPAILVDRTPLSPAAHDVAKVQHVPASIYRATYPCWFLSRRRFLALFESRYQLEAELPPHDPDVGEIRFVGLYLTLRR